MPDQEAPSREVRDYIRRQFAANAGLDAERLAEEDPTLAQVVALSPGMTNSIDLMEAFARTSNSLRKDRGVRVRLPAMPLSTPLSEVLDAFMEEYARQEQKRETVA